MALILKVAFVYTCPHCSEKLTLLADMRGEQTNCSSCGQEVQFPSFSKVLVFGTFDRLNAGHVSFLERARRFGDELIVLVVEDEFVIKYKGKSPVWSLKMRMGALSRLPFKPKVHPEDIGESWKSLKTIKPDVIVLSAEQTTWRQRLDVLLKEYNLPTRVEVLSETESDNDATSTAHPILTD